MKNFKLKEYGLIGENLYHSMSEFIHKDLWGYDYRLQNLSRDELENFFEKKDFKGINVTIPYKVDSIKYLDFLSDLAKDIGSVNTIKNNNGILTGYNTDYIGFDYMIKKAKINFKNKNILIFGSGGASKMVSKYCKNSNAKNIVIISRKGENTYKNIEKYNYYDSIINTTPVGMYPNNLKRIVDINIFKNLDSVTDLIYNPLKTGLILDAKNRNIKYASGLDMLIAQAFYSSEIFFDKKLDTKLIENTIKLAREQMINIIFVGMPGSGKTTMAKMLAKKLKREFIDTDTEIEKIEKNSISNIFKYKGEKYFRDLESKVLNKYTKERNKIISSGGGSVIRSENRDMICQNSIVVFLNRKIDKLERGGRPLSKDLSSVEKLYKERINFYRNISDIEIIVEEEIDKTFYKINEELLKNEIISN